MMHLSAALVILAAAFAVPALSAPAGTAADGSSLNPSPVDASRDSVQPVPASGAGASMGGAQSGSGGSVDGVASSSAFGVPSNTQMSGMPNSISSSGSRHSGSSLSRQQLVAVPAVGVVPAANQQTFVSTNVNSRQMNQSFATGNGPIVAILPAGSNMSATWDLSSNAQPTVGFAAAEQLSSTVPTVAVVGFAADASTSTVGTTIVVSSSTAAAVAAANVPVILPVGVVDNMAGMTTGSSVSGAVVQQNHRFEIQLIDFQMNNTANSDINQNIQLSAKVAAGALTPAATAQQNVTLVDASSAAAKAPGVMAAPETSSGMQQVFNGTYKTSLSNKISVSRTITQDLCGQNPDKAFLTVVIAPLSAADGAGFQQQSYTCIVNLNFPTAVRSSESFWSDIMQCNSGDINGFSNRLWYKVRQYNVDWADCQQNRPNPVAIA